MPRPVGVTILAILDFIGMGALILFGILAFVGMGMLGTILSSQMSQFGSMGTAAMAGVGAVLAVICFAFAAIAGIVGYGMLKLREWARILSIVFAILGIAGGSFGLFFGLIHFHVVSLFFTSIRIGINLLILWYLMQPHVKAAFAGAQSTAARA